MITRDVSLVVIGSGPAGLAAAIKAKESGIDEVVILERSEELGGLLHQCVHNGFGLLCFKEDLTGPEFACRLIEKVNELGIEYNLETMVIELNARRNIKAVNPQKGVMNLNAGAVVLAMGCRERTYHQVGVMGTRPAGVLTAGTAQRYINVEGYLPGKEVVILGSGDIGMIMARRLTLEGAKVLAVVEKLPYVGGLKRNEVQCIHDFDIPLYLQHTVTKIHGNARIEGVTMVEVDGKGDANKATERLIGCDTLLLSVGLIPENELSLQAGVKLDLLTNGPFVSERMETTIPGIFACGNVVTVYDLVDYVMWSGEIAGKSAATLVKGKKTQARKPKRGKESISIKAGNNVRFVSPQSIDKGIVDDVDIYIRVTEPMRNVEISAGDGNEDIYKKIYRAVTPGEMVVVRIPAKQLKTHNELVIKCEKLAWLGININFERCTGCRYCEAICSFGHFDEVNPVKSCIRIYNDLQSNVYFPIIAGPYTDAKCTSQRFVVIQGIEYDACALCPFCCPIRPFFMEPGTENSLKCDMCGMDPMCVQFCSSGALTLATEKEE